MEKGKPKLLYRVAKFIVQKRNLFFFIFILACAFSFFGRSWTMVESEITAYLSEETGTRIGLDLMEEEFTTFGSAKVMLCNIDYDSALLLSEEIEEIEGVNGLTFEEEDYQDGYALFSITYDAPEDDPVALQAMSDIRELIAPYDTAVDTTVGESRDARLAGEMQVVMVVAVFIVVGVLLLTSKSFGELPVLLITFGVAAFLNKGTDFIFGEISFVSNSVGIVLQLALAIDYAIILCHRYDEERKQHEPMEACTVALSKAIVEISSSSLTTICGLIAMSFMSYELGADLSRVLIKSIFISLFCVFTLMPGLLVLFSPLIDKTKHRNFIPSISRLGKAAIKVRYVVLPVFLILAVVAAVLSTKTNYLFSPYNAITVNRSETQIQEDRIESVFGTTNGLAIIVPSGDYEKESALVAELEAYPEVNQVVALANTEAMDDYMLTDSLTARQFSELMDMDYEEAALVYAAYAIDGENYGKLINNTDSYSLPLIDTILFLDDMVEDEYFVLDAEQEEDLRTQSADIRDGQLQLESENYTRMLVSLDLPTEGAETFAFVDTIKGIAESYYDEVHLVGDPTSNMDLSDAFTTDNVLISVLSALFVMAVLLGTFGSVAIPVMLILVIQSAIFMNFAFPYLKGTSVFFIGYLVVAAIQMGANVDYAIVITNRYMDLRKSMENKDAIVKALDDSFATVFTSGTILASAGIAIQHLTTDGTIATVGECIGRGTLISMVLVLLVLPQLLYIGTPLIDRTAFALKFQKEETKAKGKLTSNGHVKGYVSGYIDAEVHGTITGDISAVVTNIEEVEESV